MIFKHIKISGKAKEFLSADSIKNEDLDHQNLYPKHFNKNINPIKESYNTRLIIKKFQQHVINAEIEIFKQNPKSRNPNYPNPDPDFCNSGQNLLNSDPTEIKLDQH
ncbi:hypothetical protein RhiirA1_478401 [Rhizophagus irregularis]|uniref:Uncharacterized protein n=1 Tax=Rhizophagus irregularis TaxID=588596 RepID=A0A2N0QS44_9GLOM|nr:hypothetical protein RhiirA1_478401 [Rhizophagus irregularis]